MEAVLLIDFGSTYTKVTAADTETPRILGCAASYTTVESDVGEGLESAVTELERLTGKVTYGRRYACSSAAGGLKMVVCGLVPELTSKAARLASFGAGAKVRKTCSFQLTGDDLAEIDEISPDILLLTGGTDGGNTECALHNAAMLARRKGRCPVVVACNRSCAERALRLLKGHETHLCPNVMPTLGKLQIEAVRLKIRDIFLERIVRAKGLSRESGLLDGIMMPTPAAVLAAVELLAAGTENEAGIGELLAVDLGGATTDVYSIADGLPTESDTVYRGLPEPYAMRTVEGDIGMRYSVHGILEAVGIDRISRMSGLPKEEAQTIVDRFGRHTEALPESDGEKAVDFALAAGAIETATVRHAGSVEKIYTPDGALYLQNGKDLRNTNRIVLTGGALIHARRQAELAGFAMYGEAVPESLRPKKAEPLIDGDYILSAMGLLAGYDRQAALKIMKQSITPIG
jgi:uncharacterized protein (TIGR01319 family)